MTKVIHKKFVFPFRNFKSVLPEIERVLTEHDPILEVTGFPIRIFVSKDVRFAAAVFGHPQIGMTKLPAILPRIENVMKKRGTFIMEGGDEWKAQRASSQKAFRPQNYDSFLKHLPLVSNAYIESWKLASRHSSTATIDVFADFRKLFADLNFRMLFSYELDEVTLQQVQEATLYLDLKFVSPVPLFVPTLANYKFIKARNLIYEVFNKAILARKKRGFSETDTDLLGLLIQKNADYDQLIGEMGSIYFGASIMSTTLAWATYLIGAHPQVESAMAQEAKAFQSEEIKSHDIQTHFPYAQAVFKEVVRLFPSSWGFPRYTKEKLEILDFEIPSNSLLIPLILLTQRDPNLWENPTEFKPERFLNLPANFNRYAYTPFSMGPRSCLGSGLASLLIPTLLVMISRQLRYSFKPRFEGDPISNFGFEIHPKDRVCLEFSSS